MTSKEALKDVSQKVWNGNTLVWCANPESIVVLNKLVEKDTVKTIERHGGQYMCPTCGRRLRAHQKDPYCPRCGQRVSWNIEGE